MDIDEEIDLGLKIAEFKKTAPGSEEYAVQKSELQKIYNSLDKTDTSIQSIRGQLRTSIVSQVLLELKDEKKYSVHRNSILIMGAILQLMKVSVYNPKDFVWHLAEEYVLRLFAYLQEVGITATTVDDLEMLEKVLSKFDKTFKKIENNNPPNSENE